eukprot:Gb_31513 [translate_table: standard]
MLGCIRIGEFVKNSPVLLCQGGPSFVIQHPLRPAQLKENNVRFERIQPKMHSSNGTQDMFIVAEVKSSSSMPAGNKRSSPKAKPVIPKTSLTALIGDNDVTEKPVDPIKVYSEKELAREIENFFGMLTPEFRKRQQICLGITLHQVECSYRRTFWHQDICFAHLSKCLLHRRFITWWRSEVQFSLKISKIRSHLSEYGGRRNE